MEHEAFVPFPEAAVRRAFGDPARVARALPGWQPDDAGHPLAGRLRFRANGATITYRGTLRVKDREDGGLRLRADATESRGEGGVRARLTVRLTGGRSPEDGRPGTRITVSGRVDVDGRAATLDPAVASAAGHRLLDRFLAALAEEPGGGADDPGLAEDADSADGPDSASLPTAPAPRSPEPQPDPRPEPRPEPDHPRDEPTDADAPEAPDAADTTDTPADEDPDGPDAPLTAATPPDPDDAEETPDETDDAETDDTDDDAPGFPGPDDDDLADALPTLFPDGITVPESAAELDDLPTDAAQARRTMIGRSAEEVDHAPPRGRYAPVPAPGANRGVAALALRWAAPAAAVLLVSAAVASRVLRRRG
jgi:hypothetical protein